MNVMQSLKHRLPLALEATSTSLLGSCSAWLSQHRSCSSSSPRSDDTNWQDDTSAFQEDPDEEPQPLSPAEVQQLARRMARQSHAAEVSAAAFFKGQAGCGRLSGHDVDMGYFREQEQQLLQGARQQLLRNKARPSALQGVLGIAGLALGAVASAAPRNINLAITGALQDALTDHFTEQIRRLHEAGAGDEAAGVRELLRRLRDAERAPDGAPPAPDLIALSKMTQVSDLGVEGAVGAVVKAGALAALNLAAKV